MFTIKYTLKNIQKYFEDQGCKLISKKYRKTTDRLKYQCKCGRMAYSTFHNFRYKLHCKQCGYNNGGKAHKNNQKDVEEFYSVNGCKLLDNYKGCEVSHRFLCKCGVVTSKSFENFKKRPLCRKCSIKRFNIKNQKNVILNKKIRQRCYCLLKRTLKKINQSKDQHTKQLLGYNSKDLHEHLKSFPCWQNIQNKKWHIDHIYPIKAFVDYNITDLKIINSLDNLQPLLATENLNKSDKYIIEDFEKWLINKNVEFQSKL